MTVHDLTEKLALHPLSLANEERELSGVYINDLLSWVMGRASCDNVWITIMSNINIIAVAALADVSCIVLAEGVTLEESVLTTAKQKGINVFSTEKTAYEVAAELARLGL